MPSEVVFVFVVGYRNTGSEERTCSIGRKRLHVEDINPLHLPQDLQTLQARGLLEICGDCARFRARTDEVCLFMDLFERYKLAGLQKGAPI